MNPKISIVTPSFNQGEFLEETIDSVLSQDYDNLEYIIIDGGSNDKSVEIIKKYESHLAYWVSEKDSGQSEAINKGLTRSSGVLFNWLNSDDLLEVNALNTIAELYSSREGVACVIGNIQIFGDESRVYNDKVLIDEEPGALLARAKIKQPSTYYSMDAVKRMGPLNESLHYIMDYEWFIRFMLTNSLKNAVEVDDVFSKFRIHDASKTGTDIDAFEEHKIKFWTELYDWRIEGKNKPSLVNYEAYNSTLVDSAISYFFYRKLIESYASESRARCLELISRINPEHLDERRKRELSKLKVRVKFIPRSLRS